MVYVNNKLYWERKLENMLFNTHTSIVKFIYARYNSLYMKTRTDLRIIL